MMKVTHTMAMAIRLDLKQEVLSILVHVSSGNMECFVLLAVDLSD